MSTPDERRQARLNALGPGDVDASLEFKHGKLGVRLSKNSILNLASDGLDALFDPASFEAVTGSPRKLALKPSKLVKQPTLDNADADERALAAAIQASVLDAIYPVGSIYVTVNTSLPAAIAALGRWSAFAPGRVLMGLDSGDATCDTPEETGGANTVAAAGTVAAPVFTGSALGTHQHAVTTNVTVGDHGTQNVTVAGIDIGLTLPAEHDVVNNTVASTAVSAGTPAGTNSAPAFTGSATSVRQPYITVSFFKRTA